MKYTPLLLTLLTLGCAPTPATPPMASQFASEKAAERHVRAYHDYGTATRWAHWEHWASKKHPGALDVGGAVRWAAKPGRTMYYIATLRHGERKGDWEPVGVPHVWWKYDYEYDDEPSPPKRPFPQPAHAKTKMQKGQL